MQVSGAKSCTSILMVTCMCASFRGGVLHKYSDGYMYVCACFRGGVLHNYSDGYMYVCMFQGWSLAQVF